MSGLVVAARLAENLDVTVAVLEAGRDNYGDFLICAQLITNFCVSSYDICSCARTARQSHWKLGLRLVLPD